VSQPLVICCSCKCHIRIGEAACPHCGTDLAAVGAKRAPLRRSFEIRRVVYATAALASLSTASCGGRLVGDETGSTSAAAERDILGTCMRSSTSSFFISRSAADGGGPSCAWDPAGSECQCGPAGTCENGACVQITCDDGQYLDSSGQCHDIYWFSGNLDLPSTNGCYGAPPFLG
jgi:hypothetical protein